MIPSFNGFIRKIILGSLLFAPMWVYGYGQTVQLNTLEGKEIKISEGVSWGVPFPKGTIKKNLSFTLTTHQGATLPIQTWPLAYWPDGSIKWLGCATVTPAATKGTLNLSVLPVPTSIKRAASARPELGSTATASASNAAAMLAQKKPGGIQINTGSMQCFIPAQGTEVIQNMVVNGKTIASEGHLVCSLEKTEQFPESISTLQQKYSGRIDRVTLEQEGPVRAVVKIEGKHFSPALNRAWLPFVVRIYFYAGETSIKMVHSIVFDGDGNKDFIKSLGVEFTIPFREEAHNRHMRFAGEALQGSGFWVQPIRLIPGYRPNAGTEVTERYAAHLAGQKIPDLAGFSERSRTAILTCPVWGDMRLSQPNPNGFSIDKKTQGSSSWLHVTDGRRSLGGALLGDASGSLFAGIRNFWQKYPSSIEVRNAGTPKGTLSLWFWSPEAESMDLRSYDTIPHDLSINYEDWKPGWNTPEGIANTNELNIRLFDNIPSNDQLLEVAQAAQSPMQLVCTPEYYHSVRAFGVWSLPDPTNPVNQAIEGELNRTISYLQGQVEQRYWYGFWNYGDIMHNYDFGRNEWRYDIGGWAWANTELLPDMFLWVSFLRTGRADIWKMAEAMTRHTSESDVHHLGAFAPLGSRHNVTHWGDGAKQPRISHSGLKRFYYYLTTDERTGDLMREQLPADSTYDQIKRNDTRNPARGTYIGHAFGTDWCSYVFNWMTEWERTGNIYWRDRILNGMKDLMALGQDGAPSSGGTYDISTGRFLNRQNVPASSVPSALSPQATTPQTANSMSTPPNRPYRGPTYFDMIFGGPEMMSELMTMIDYQPFWDGWLKVCQSLANTAGGQMTGPRMAAWSAYLSKDAQMGQLAWKELLDNTSDEISPGSSLVPGRQVTNSGLLHPVEDPIFLGKSAGWQFHNPSSMQWALNAIEVMEMAKGYQPAQVPEKFKNTINY